MKIVTLNELRKNSGLTQAGLASELGMSKSTIAMYELGQRTPNLKTALEIAKYFGVNVEKIRFSSGKDA